FFYRARAINPCGVSIDSEPIQLFVSAPSPPLFISASLGDSNSVELYWAENLQGIDAFYVQRAVDVQGAPGDWADAAVGAGIDWHYMDRQVMTNTTYWYRLYASNGLGVSTFSEAASVAVTPPPALAAAWVSASPTSVRVFWSDIAPSDTVQGYKIERAVDV